jgi:septal ring factor EnvC (AmiA/AmiB activator)
VFYTSPAVQLREKVRSIRAALGLPAIRSKSSIAVGLLLIAVCALSVQTIRLSQQLQTAKTNLKETATELEAARKREAAGDDGRAALALVVAQADELLEDINRELRKVDVSISEIESNNSQIGIGNDDLSQQMIRAAAFDASLVLSRMRGRLSAWEFYHASDVDAARFSPDL